MKSVVNSYRLAYALQREKREHLIDWTWHSPVCSMGGVKGPRPELRSIPIPCTAWHWDGFVPLALAWRPLDQIERQRDFSFVPVEDTLLPKSNQETHLEAGSEAKAASPEVVEHFPYFPDPATQPPKPPSQPPSQPPSHPPTTHLPTNPLISDTSAKQAQVMGPALLSLPMILARDVGSSSTRRCGQGETVVFVSFQ